MIVAAAALLVAATVPPAGTVPSGGPAAGAVPAAGGWLDAATARRVARNPPLGAVPADRTNRWSDSLDAARLGHRLFFDARLSASGTVSCASCHDPAHGFRDSEPLAKGEGTGPRRSMSVLNSAHQRWLTWDGRADTLWSQAVQPFEVPHEMGSSRRAVLAVVAGDPQLSGMYRTAFGAPVPDAAAAQPDVDAAFAKLGKALAAYERRLVSGPSAYDRWWSSRASGDPSADTLLSDAERRGLALFFGKANCFQCHHGALFSDGEFHNIGMPPRGGGMPTDAGRYAVVDRVRDDPFNAAGPHSDDRSGPQARISASLVNSPERWGEFRTPSLRNLPGTGPFMHAGQKETLAEVVRFYSTLEGATQLDHHRESVLKRLDLTEAEQADLVAFLGALAGSAPAEPWNSPPGRNADAPTR